MILNSIRAILILLLIFVILVDINVPIIINTATNQLFIAIIILLIILTVDEIIGFLIGCIFLIIYFKFYQKKITSNNDTLSSSLSSTSLSLSPFISTSPFISGPSVVSENDNSPLTSLFNFFSGDVKPKANTIHPEIPEHFVQDVKNDNCKLISYISNDLLKAAQNNIYNDINYNTEIKHDSNYYGIQGLNSDNIHYVAFDNNFNNFSNYNNL